MQAAAVVAAAAAAADADADADAAVEGAVASVAASAVVQQGPCSDLQRHRKLLHIMKLHHPYLPQIQTTACTGNNGDKTDGAAERCGDASSN